MTFQKNYDTLFRSSEYKKKNKEGKGKTFSTKHLVHLAFRGPAPESIPEVIVIGYNNISLEINLNDTVVEALFVVPLNSFLNKMTHHVVHF